MTDAIAAQRTEAMRLRARSFMAFVLTPSRPINEWLAQLDKWSGNSPNFFAGRPIILDLAGAAVAVSEIAPLITHLAARGIRIMLSRAQMRISSPLRCRPFCNADTPTEAA